MDLEQQERRLKLEEYKRKKLQQKETILKESGIVNKTVVKKAEQKKRVEPALAKAAVPNKTNSNLTRSVKAPADPPKVKIGAPKAAVKVTKPTATAMAKYPRTNVERKDNPSAISNKPVTVREKREQPPAISSKPSNARSVKNVVETKPILKKQPGRATAGSTKAKYAKSGLANELAQDEERSSIEQQNGPEKDSKELLNHASSPKDIPVADDKENVNSILHPKHSVEEPLKDKLTVELQPTKIQEQKSEIYKHKISFATDAASPLRARIQRLNTPRFDRTRIMDLDQSVKKLEEHFREIKLETKPKIKEEAVLHSDTVRLDRTPQNAIPKPPVTSNVIFDTYSPADSIDSENIFEDSPLMHVQNRTANSWDFNDSPILERQKSPARESAFTPKNTNTSDIFNEISAPTPGSTESIFDESSIPTQTPSKNYEMSFSEHVPDMDISVMDDEGDLNLSGYEDEDYKDIGGLVHETKLHSLDILTSEVMDSNTEINEIVPGDVEHEWNLSDALKMAETPTPDIYIEYARYEEKWQNYSKVADLFFQAADLFTSAKDLEIIDEAYRGFEIRLGQEYMYYNADDMLEYSVEEIENDKAPEGDSILKDLDFESFNESPVQVKRENAVDYKVLKKDRKDAVNEIVNLLGELKISKPKKPVYSFSNISKPEKKLKIGVPVKQEEANITILTPMKVKPKLQKEYGTDTVITPARRSKRLFDEGEYHCSANPEDEGASTKEKIQTLLSENGYAYAPNKVGSD
ncbi:hypothetical protein HK103_002521 [Boothiomyces macroporosus]|uniref:Uncharacterized protein n=1 Tax=Boothiomyces macroporosus TaxID=261099 RepID=A0AAD5UJ68_9FUNG|nr:hypothetical protein HK103_002521 [Boothiomyces macroporosus]